MHIYTPSFYVNPSVPQEQIQAAVAWLFGIPEAQVFFINQAPIVAETGIVIHVIPSTSYLPQQIQLFILALDYDPPDSLNMIDRLCEKWGCQGLVYDPSVPDDTNYYILFNRFPRRQRVVMNGYAYLINTPPMFENFEYRELL